MNSERAWLIIETSEMDLTHAVFKFRNYGRTPARLIKIAITYVVHQSPEIWPVDYSDLEGILYAPNLIGPSTSTPLYAANIRYSGDISEGSLQFRHIYGIVQYEDTFGREHITPFYYSLRNGIWLLSGPPEANNCT